REALESEIPSGGQQLGSGKKMRKRDDRSIIDPDIWLVHPDEVLRDLADRVRPFTEPEVGPPLEITLLAAGLNIEARFVPGEQWYDPKTAYLRRPHLDIQTIAQLNDPGELFE